MRTMSAHFRPIFLSTLMASLPLLTAAAAAASDPSGTWAWSRTGRDGTEMKTTLKLKAEGSKLTGTISGRNDTETAISQGAVQGSEIRFEVSRENNSGNQVVAKYAAKVEGDSLKGTIKMVRNGEERTRDWTATRASAGPEGTWKYSFTTQNGNTLEPVLVLKLQGEKVMGTMKVNEYELPVEGTYKDGKLAFTMKGERDGRTWSSRIEGQVKGDKLAARATQNWNGEERVREFEATRVKE